MYLTKLWKKKKGPQKSLGYLWVKTKKMVGLFTAFKYLTNIDSAQMGE